MKPFAKSILTVVVLGLFAVGTQVQAGTPTSGKGGTPKKVPAKFQPGDINMNKEIDKGDLELLQDYLSGTSGQVAPLALYDELDLFVNLRPIRLLSEKFCPLKGKGPDDIDFVVVRENTEDAYAGIGGILKKGTPWEVAVQSMVYTRHGVERVVRFAYQLCRKRNKKKRLMLVDKANAIRAQEIWTRVFKEVGEEFPDIEQDHSYVDAACMWMVKNPESFDTVVTTNLFGDIITDLGAVLQGGMGVAASGNIHPGKVSMFESIHGSAPKYKGLNKACPIAAIVAVQMMLDHLGEESAAARIEASVASVLNRDSVTSVDASSGIATDEWGAMIVEEMRSR